jgi:hypothetical protein
MLKVLDDMCCISVVAKRNLGYLAQFYVDWFWYKSVTYKEN